MTNNIILEFYPLDFDYTIQNNKSVIRMYGVTRDGKRIIVLDDSFNPYFYITFEEGTDIHKVEDKIRNIKITSEERVISVINVEKVSKKLLGRHIDAIKITVAQPPDIQVLREELKKIEGYKDKIEFDIPFVKRYLIDRKIVPLACLRINGEDLAEHEMGADFVVLAKHITELEESQLVNPKILAFDIETYNPIGTSRTSTDPVIMISFESNTGHKKVITWKKFENAHDYVEFVETEKDLIEHAMKYIEEERPYFLCGYNTDNFDLPYLAARAAKYKMHLMVGNSKIKFSKSVREATAKIKGLVHLDLYKFVRNTLAPNLETEAFDLDSVAEELIGEKKKEGVHWENIHDSWDKGGANLKNLVEYALHDSHLVLRLTEKLYPMMSELTKLIGQPIFDVSRMTYGQSVEWFLIKNADGLGEFVPNKPIDSSVANRITKTYVGAYVHEPKPGLYENVVVFDFRSLYPSIIVSHNICPTTINCSCCKESSSAGTWFCKKIKGFIPSVLDDLIKRRERIKEILRKMDKKSSDYNILSARSYALKTVANAMYGYLGFARSRWYNIDCAAAITAWGRHYIKNVIELAETEKFGVIYGDTDSVMMTLGKKKLKDTENFVDKVNKTLSEVMELEFQGFYPRGIFVSKKTEIEKGAKKKYALVDEHHNIIIRGFEYVRRDWSEIAKSTQMDVIKAILIDGSKEKALDILKNAINKLRSHNAKIDDVTMYTQLTRRIESYESIGPHVAAAIKATKNGYKFEPGQIIKHIVVRGEGSISDKSYIIEEVREKNLEYDPDYYINNQVIPAVGKIFEVLGYSKDELLGKLQTTLGGFLGGK